MKAQKKVVPENEIMKLVFIVLVTFFCFVGIFIDIIPKFEEIVASSDPLAWSNSWMLDIVVEFIGIIFVSLLLNSFFINTKKTNNPVLFLSYIAGGILFGFIISVIVLAILSTNSLILL